MTEQIKEVSEQEKRRLKIQGVREMLNFLEANENIELPFTDNLSVYSYNTKEEAKMLVKALGECEKKYLDEVFWLCKQFGAVTLSFMFTRGSVCNRIVVGTEEIPETIIPETIRPAYTKEIVKYECEPILAE